MLIAHSNTVKLGFHIIYVMFTRRKLLSCIYVLNIVQRIVVTFTTLLNFIPPNLNFLQYKGSWAPAKCFSRETQVYPLLPIPILARDSTQSPSVFSIRQKPQCLFQILSTMPDIKCNNPDHRQQFLREIYRFMSFFTSFCGKEILLLTNQITVLVTSRI